MPQQCNTLGKLEDPQVPQMQKQYLDGKKRNKQTTKTPVLYTTKPHSSFKIHPPAIYAISSGLKCTAVSQK